MNQNYIHKNKFKKYIYFLNVLLNILAKTQLITLKKYLNIIGREITWIDSI